MNVKLIAVTKPLIEGIETGEQLMSFAARVSNPSNQLNNETADKLLGYCIRNKHWSVFEQADMTIEIKTSRAIAAQVLRHKSFSFQEFSQRYAVATELEPLEWRMQGKTNRQVGDESTDLDSDLKIFVESAQTQAHEAYDRLVKAGVAKECARMVLPLNTQTTLYVKGTVRSWIHYLEQRCSDHAQKEHRDIAVVIRAIFTEQFPNVAKALNYP